MGPVKAMRTCLGKSFNFSGRASRSEHWWFLPAGVALPVCALIIAQRAAPDHSFPALSVIFFLALLPLMAITRRRFLDSAESVRWFEIPLMALLGCLASGWAIGALFEWTGAVLDSRTDGPPDFVVVSVIFVWLLGAIVLIPVFLRQSFLGFVSGSALFGQMAAPSDSLSDKSGIIRQR